MPYFDSDRVRIYYEIAGQGRPLLCIPGWTLNHRLWDPVRPLLEPRFTLVRPDVRGTGKSSGGRDIEYSRVAEAEDLERLLDHLGFASAHLLGHSKGARTAMVFAMLNPERTRSVTCIGSAEPHPGGGQPTFRSIARAWAGRAREKAVQDGPEAALEMLGSAKLLGKMRASASRVRLLRLAMEGYAADDLLSEVPARSIDTAKGARNIRGPVMFLVGEEDPFLTECRYAHDRIPGSRLMVLSACGHMVPLEAPEKIADALLDFLA